MAEKNSRKITRWKCLRCNQFKSVFETDIYNRKTCIECGDILVMEVLEI